MFETYRMLGEQREAELLREAQRLHAHKTLRDGGVLRKPRRRLVSGFRGGAVVLVIRLRGLTTRAAEKASRASG